VSVFLTADKGQFGELSTSFERADAAMSIELPDSVCSHLMVRSDGQRVWILVCCRESDVEEVALVLTGPGP
jgi:hypothetical protein